MSSVGNETNQGFSLIELMVAILIVGILASIGYPSYQNSVRGSRRAIAQADLMAFASAMERRFSLLNSYQGAASGGANTGSPDPTIFQSTSPTTGGEVYYNLSISQAPNPFQYTLRAVPVNAQTGDGFLELSQDGTRVWDANDNNSIDPGENDWER